jgi:cell division protein FtsZ
VDFADVRTVMSEMGMAMMGSASAVGENRANEAALSAISSPLLEDINISGARGLLVNVTAGLAMSIGEFEEVGTTVKEFAADDATVVVGTVIDPDMQDELRVTIVATGLGQGQKRQQPYHVVRTGTGTLDYEELDTPTVIRNRRSSQHVAATGEATLEYLDIPAFLRKQAD